MSEKGVFSEIGPDRIPEVTIHLGLHKTATGSLQRQLFPACQDVNLLTTINDDVRRFVHQLTRKDPIYFEAAEALSMIEPLLVPGKVNLLSNESLSGPPYAGVIEHGLDHRGPILQNLSAAFPRSKAFIVLRRQDQLAKSLYRQYLKSGGTRDAKRFYGFGSDRHPPLMPPDRFRFGSYIDALKDAFPSGLLVLAFEEFIHDQPKFLREIASFVGFELPTIDLKRENATKLGPFGMEVTRILNHFFRNLLNPAGILPGLPLKRFGTRRLVSPVELIHDHAPEFGARTRRGTLSRVADEILAGVREDNKRFCERHSLDFQRYGYY